MFLFLIYVIIVFKITGITHSNYVTEIQATVKGSSIIQNKKKRIYAYQQNIFVYITYFKYSSEISDHGSIC